MCLGLRDSYVRSQNRNPKQCASTYCFRDFSVIFLQIILETWFVRFHISNIELVERDFCVLSVNSFIAMTNCCCRVTRYPPSIVELSRAGLSLVLAVPVEDAPLSHIVNTFTYFSAGICGRPTINSPQVIIALTIRADRLRLFHSVEFIASKMSKEGQGHVR